jgi:signal transduction histidine kinase/CheY-like chemotaxis protein
MSPGDLPQVESKTSNNSALFWLFGVFICALLLVLGLKAVFSNLYDDLADRSANERARLFIGEEIVSGIHGVEKNIYRMAATTNSAAVRRLNQDVDVQLKKLAHDLRVLKDGGTVRREILLNIEGRDQMVREVSYRPDAKEQGYVMEVIEISPLLDQVQGKIDELSKLLALRREYREREDRARFFTVEQDISSFLKHLPPFFLRLDENANRLFYDSSERLRGLELEIGAQRSRFKSIEVFLITLVVTLALLAGFMVMRRIGQSKRRLELALDEMKAAKNEAERASRAKSEFVSRMSHELRTPLNAIIGFADLLQAEPLQPSHQNYVSLINRSGRHLMDLINQVLDHAKIESGQLRLERIPFDFRADIDEVLAIVSDRASSKGLNFIATIADDLPEHVMGDPTRLRQILVNLLVNAVKFTEKGSVELRIAPEGERIFFSIRDTGIGMDQAARGRLFQAFGQADDSITRKFGGTGLGLVISRELVQAMGGDIEVDSAPGVGSCFWFSLPLQFVEKPKAADPSPSMAETGEGSLAELVKGRLLLVDDNRVNQQLASAMLKKLGLAHDIANQGIQALEMMGARPYVAVLMDMEMPEMDGITATATWRKQERESHAGHLPIIAMTANAMQEDKERCFDAGMDGYISKPVNMAALGGELRRVLQGLGASGKSADSANPAGAEPQAAALPHDMAPGNPPALESQDGALTPAPAALSGQGAHHESAAPTITAIETGFNRAQAVAQIEDEELFAQLAAVFVAGVPDTLSELDQALTSGDWERLRRSAHTLKGLFGTFAAPNAQADAKRLEAAAAAGEADACGRLAPGVRRHTQALAEALRPATSP